MTTVAQPTYEIGQIGTEILIERLKGNSFETRRVVLKPRLVVRKSCRNLP
ncbi:MAG TPA: LacI family transcriptional regulator [Firmicutes bacterium]|nr:LacI family transcriptional regulator [Bacillota bacterium]